MLTLLLFAVAWGACLARSNEYYSYSPALGLGSGTSFTSSGEGAITGVKIWEISGQYIVGIQLRHGRRWGKVLGRVGTDEVRMDLFDGEAITQVSGKYNPPNYIYQLVFVTSKGRVLMSGQPTQVSFNFYPSHAEAELRMLSGRFNGNGITSLGAHWGMVYTGDSMEKEPSEMMTANEYYSYSPALGRGSGTSFTSSGEGAITGVKIWESPGRYITGIQLRHGRRWGKVLGLNGTDEVRMDLFDGEAITQVSGKYSSYVYQLVFVTSKGRLLMSGQPTQVSFNFYPSHAEAELRMLSGRFNGNGITSLGAHWGVVYTGDSMEK